MEPTKKLADLPLAEADQYTRDQIEHHRQEMARWRRLRAQRVAAERASGADIADIMEILGVTRDVVQRLLRAAKSDTSDSAG